MQKFVFIYVDRINFYADDAKVLAGNLYGSSYIGDIRHMAAFTGQHQYFLHAG